MVEPVQRVLSRPSYLISLLASVFEFCVSAMCVNPLHNLELLFRSYDKVERPCVRPFFFSRDYIAHSWCHDSGALRTCKYKVETWYVRIIFTKTTHWLKRSQIMHGLY